jgi:hypothetical protein
MYGGLHIMKRINMAKYGFIRTPDDDFSDDGNRFTCYQAGEYENIRISKLVSDGQVYLSAQVTCNLPYEIYGKLPHYDEATWKYNGVNLEGLTEEDMQNFYKACCAYAQECIDTEADTKYPTLEELEARCELIQAKCQRDYDEAAQFISEAVLNGKITKVGAWDITYIFDYLKSLKSAVNNWDPKKRAPRLLGKAESLKLMEPDCYELKNESFYVKAIKEHIEKFN